MKEKIVIVKAGGKVLDSALELEKLMDSIVAISDKKIVVHGGGIFIDALCEKLAIDTQMVNGRRITSKETMEVVLMTCAGKLNKELVAGINSKGLKSVGLCGADLNMIQSVKRNPVPVDFGMVGDIVNVDTQWLQLFFNNDVVPIISSISLSNNFELLNTNADTIASSIASALSEQYNVELFFYFDKKGVLMDSQNHDSIINVLSYDEFLIMKHDKAIHTGMLPKLENGFLALKSGVKQVVLGNSYGKGTKLTFQNKQNSNTHA